MPKWSEKNKRAPIPGLKRKPVIPTSLSIDTGEPVDTNDKSRAKDSQYIETLEVDNEIHPEGFRFEVINNTGLDYRVVFEHVATGQLWGCVITDREGNLPIPGLIDLTGRWVARLLADDQIIDTVEFEAQLSLGYHLECVGAVEIRYSDTEGGLTRLGGVKVLPWTRGQHPCIDPNMDAFVVIVHFTNLPVDMPRDVDYSIEIYRPDDGGLYFRGTMPVIPVSGWKVSVRDRFPSTESGPWMVIVSIDGTVVSRSYFHMGQGPTEVGDRSVAVEEFLVAI